MSWTKPFITLFIATVAVLALSRPAAPQASGLPPGPERSLVQGKCLYCHPVSQITAYRRTANEWAQVVEDMINRGAAVSDDEFDSIVDYLAEHFGPDEASARGDKISSMPCNYMTSGSGL